MAENGSEDEVTGRVNGDLADGPPCDAVLGQLACRISCAKRKLDEMDFADYHEDATTKVRMSVANGSSSSSFDQEAQLEHEDPASTVGVASSLHALAVAASFSSGFSSGTGASDVSQQGKTQQCSTSLRGNEEAEAGPLSRTQQTSVSVANDDIVQFFVRGYNKTWVLHLSHTTTISKVYEVLSQRTGIPVTEQRLVFGGRQLQGEDTLRSLKVSNMSTLQLTSRLRSTQLPCCWQLVQGLVQTVQDFLRIGGQCAAAVEYQTVVRSSMKRFLQMAGRDISENRPAEHMAIFQMAGGTNALTMLLLSPVDCHHETAEACISLFFMGSDEDSFSSPELVQYCAPVLLHFCQLLSKRAPFHPIYLSCRSALSRLVETVGGVTGAGGLSAADPATILADLSPFVDELAGILCKYLWSEEQQLDYSKPPLLFQSSAMASPFLPLAQEFASFLVPVCWALVASDKTAVCDKCKGAMDCCACDSPSSSESDCGGATCHSSGGSLCSCCVGGLGHSVGTVQWLRCWCMAIFRGVLALFDRIQRLLQESKDKESEHDAMFLLVKGYCVNSPVLAILKGLNVFVAFRHDDPSQWWCEMLESHREALNLFVVHAQLPALALAEVSEPPWLWLCGFKHLLAFEAKRKLVMTALQEPNDDHDERHEVTVHRGPSLLSDSFEAIAYVDPEVLQNGVMVEFTDEMATGPGVVREWFALVVNNIFNVANALFVTCPGDGRCVYPNSASGVNPGHLMYFRFCGRMLALALMHRVQLDVRLSRALFKQLGEQPVTLDDIADVDPLIHSSCRALLEMPAEMVESLGLVFCWEVEELGTRRSINLHDMGDAMPVTAENRHLFVDRLIEKRIVEGVREQVRNMSQGFRDLMPNQIHSFLDLLAADDLNLMMYGKDGDGVDVADWQAHTQYHDYCATDVEIQWFWEVVKGMDVERRSRLLFFSTSVIRLPVEGFSGLPSKFHIHKSGEGPNYYPTSHTCFYQLLLPQYLSLGMTREKLYAITELHTAVGFGFP